MKEINYSFIHSNGTSIFYYFDTEGVTLFTGKGTVASFFKMMIHLLKRRDNFIGNRAPLSKVVIALLKVVPSLSSQKS